MKITLNDEYSYKQLNFNAMKKSQFKGIDRFVVDTYNKEINVQKFNRMEDFYKCCRDLISEIKIKDFSGRRSDIQPIRYKFLKEWFEYLSSGKSIFTDSIVLMVLKSITKDLRHNEDNLPPVLEKNVLIKTIKQVQSYFETGEKPFFDFNKEYKINLQNSYLPESFDNNNFSGWIIIPSEIHDKENFEENLKKLMTLSHSNWCTNSFFADKYLKAGDMHIYWDGGKPQIGIRFDGDLIDEMQEARHNGGLSLQNYDIVRNHIQKYKLTDRAKSVYESLETGKKERDYILQTLFGRGIENYTLKEVLSKLGIKCEENPDKTLTISEYRQPTENVKYGDLGMNENDMFKSIKKIVGNATFADSDCTDTGILEEIGGDANFITAKLKSLFNIRNIGGNALLCCSNIKNTGQLETIGRDALIMNSKLDNLNGVRVKGNIFK